MLLFHDLAFRGPDVFDWGGAKCGTDSCRGGMKYVHMHARINFLKI